MQPFFEIDYFCSKHFNMEHPAFINLDLLSQEARKELETFYEYLLFKYKQPRKAKQDDASSQVTKFREFADGHQIHLPEDYKFDREEANERSEK